MKRLRKLLAVILTASMLLGNTGITYAAEAAADSAAALAVQEEERSDAGTSRQAAAEADD